MVNRLLFVNYIFLLKISLEKPGIWALSFFYDMMYMQLFGGYGQKLAVVLSHIRNCKTTILMVQ
jgi:hypothetical protein